MIIMAKIFIPIIEKKIGFSLFSLVFHFVFRKISGKPTNCAATIQRKLSLMQRNEKEKPGGLHKKQITKRLLSRRDPRGRRGERHNVQ